MRDARRTTITRGDASHPIASAGFTLIEMMIVIAIIGILATIAIPQYETYSKRSRFTEVVLATKPYKTTAEIAVQSGRVGSEAELDAGAFGIPDPTSSSDAVSTHVSSVSMTDGTIVAVGTASVSNAVFALQASIVNGGVVWTEDPTVANACQGLGLC